MSIIELIKKNIRGKEKNKIINRENRKGPDRRFM